MLKKVYANEIYTVASQGIPDIDGFIKKCRPS